MVITHKAYFAAINFLAIWLFQQLTYTIFQSNVPEKPEMGIAVWIPISIIDSVFKGEPCKPFNPAAEFRNHSGSQMEC